MRRLAMSLSVPAVAVLAAIPLGVLPGRGLLPAGFVDGGGSRAGASRAGAQAGPSERDAPGRIDHLALACADQDREDEPAIACHWSKAERPDFGSYRLLRSRGADPDDRIVVFHTTDRDTTRFVDETVHPNVTYTYRVEAIDDSGQVIARSKDVKAVDRSPEPDHVKLACRDADRAGGEAARPEGDAEAIACRWTASRRPGFAAYRLLRSTAGQGGSPVVVFQTNDRDTTSYRDGTAVPGTTYDYVLEVTNSGGDVIDRSNVSRAGDEDSERPRLACRDADPRAEGAPGEGERIGCRWSPSPRDDFGGYRLTRSVPGSAQPPVVVFQSDDRGQTSFVDTGTTEGVTYQYTLEVLDRAGHVVAASEPVRAGGGEEGPSPQAGAASLQPAAQPQPQPAPRAAGGGGRAGTSGGRDRRR